MTTIPSLKLVNLGGVTPDFNACKEFFQNATGVQLGPDGDASGVPYLRAQFGSLDINLFVQPIFTVDAVSQGWSHVSFETPDLAPFLNSPDWQRVMVKEPWTIETRDDLREIAFFEPAPGLRIEIMKITRTLPAADTVPGASTIYEAQGRLGNTVGLLHRAGHDSVLGHAFTVKCQTGDNLAVHRAVAEAQPGEILVIAGNNAPIGYVGDILVQAAAERGIAGIIIDGGARDISELKRIGLPVWSTQVAMAGATKVSLGGIRSQIQFAGANVNHGDIVRVDSDGAVFVPSLKWAEVLELAQARDASEEEVVRRVQSGETTLDIFNLAR